MQHTYLDIKHRQNSFYFQFMYKIVLKFVVFASSVKKDTFPTNMKR